MIRPLDVPPARERSPRAEANSPLSPARRQVGGQNKCHCFKTPSQVAGDSTLGHRVAVQFMVMDLQSPLLLLCHGLNCRAQVGALGKVTNFHNKSLFVIGEPLRGTGV